MANITPDTKKSDEEKNALYADITQQILAVIDGETNQDARIVTAICLLHQGIDYFDWTGIYKVDPQKPDELVIGPYQGSLGCLRIPFAKGKVRGVCGASAASQDTVIVDDVHEFTGHISCDSRMQSEIVVPIFTKAGALYGVLDIDSLDIGQFSIADQTHLEGLMAAIML